MHITNELIHNPGVNEKLDEMGVNFVPGNILEWYFVYLNVRTMDIKTRETKATSRAKYVSCA